MTEARNEDNTLATQNDPLGEDISSIDTSFPLLSPGLYDMEISKAEVMKKKDDPTRDVLTLTLKTTNDSFDVKNQALNKGFPIMHRIALTPSEDMSVDKIKRNIASVAQRCGISGTVRDLLNNLKPLEGKVVRVKVGIQKETEEYPASNTVKQFVDIK